LAISGEYFTTHLFSVATEPSVATTLREAGLDERFAGTENASNGAALFEVSKP